MGKRSQSQPAPPDPYAVAGAQTQQNQDSAEYNAAINRTNTYTPYGSQEYTNTGTDPSTGAPLYRQDINLSEGQQRLFDQQQEQGFQMGQLGGNVLDNLTGQPIDRSGLPELNRGPNMTGATKTEFDQVGPQMNVDRSGLPALPGQDDLTGFRDEAEGAIYDRSTQYLDDQTSREETSMRSRLANQGIVEGSEAFTNAMTDFNRGKEQAYSGARNDAIIGGGAEAERMSRIGSNNRGQIYGEELSGGAFANSAAGQQTAQNRDAAGFNNDARNQEFGQQLAAGGFNNNARAQGLEEELAMRAQPLNEYSALRSGGQVTLPQFQGQYNAQTNPADIAGAMQNQYQGQVDSYNANQNSQNGFMGGLFGLGASYLGRPSSSGSGQ